METYQLIVDDGDVLILENRSDGISSSIVLPGVLHDPISFQAEAGLLNRIRLHSRRGTATVTLRAALEARHGLILGDEDANRIVINGVASPEPSSDRRSRDGGHVSIGPRDGDARAATTPHVDDASA